MVKTLSVLMAFLMSAGSAFAEFRTGDCLVLPGSSVDLGGTVPGLIAEVAVDVGNSVAKGQILASLRTEVQETLLRLTTVRAGNRSAVNAAQAQLDFERLEYQRILKLHERGVATDVQFSERKAALILRESELEDALAQAKEAEIDVERAKAELEVRRIRSPIDGVVADRHLNVGEFLRDDERVLTLVELDPLRVEVFLPQSAYPFVNPGEVVQVSPEIGPAGPFDAKISTVDPVIDPASATFRVRLELSNSDLSIISGIRCSAYFPSLDSILSK